MPTLPITLDKTYGELCADWHSLHDGHDEIDQECSSGDPHERANLANVARDGRHDHEGDEAKADAVGNGIRERNASDDHERREGLDGVGS